MPRHASIHRFAISILGTGVLAGSLWTSPAAALEDVDRYLFVPNRVSADVAVIDTVSRELVARVQVGQVPHQVAVSERLGKMVASNTEDNTISVIDLRTLKTEATLTLGNTPEHMEIAPGGDVLAVGNIGAGTVSLVSLVENRETARVEGLYEPHNLTFSADGQQLFVANLGADHVSVIDVAQGRRRTRRGQHPGGDRPGQSGEDQEPGARRAALEGLRHRGRPLHAGAQQRRRDGVGRGHGHPGGGGHPAGRRGHDGRQHGLSSSTWSR
jgi:YVTN family beta-propeller protein